MAGGKLAFLSQILLLEDWAACEVAGYNCRSPWPGVQTLLGKTGGHVQPIQPSPSQYAWHSGTHTEVLRSSHLSLPRWVTLPCLSFHPINPTVKAQLQELTAAVVGGKINTGGANQSLFSCYSLMLVNIVPGCVRLAPGVRPASL